MDASFYTSLSIMLVYTIIQTPQRFSMHLFSLNLDFQKQFLLNMEKAVDTHR